MPSVGELNERTWFTRPGKPNLLVKLFNLPGDLCLCADYDGVTCTVYAGRSATPIPESVKLTKLEAVQRGDRFKFIIDVATNNDAVFMLVGDMRIENGSLRAIDIVSGFVDTFAPNEVVVIQEESK